MDGKDYVLSALVLPAVCKLKLDNVPRVSRKTFIWSVEYMLSWKHFLKV